MGEINEVDDRARGYRRSKAAWLSLVTLGVFLVVACSGGAIATTGASDPAPEIELTLFENENHSAGESLTLSQFQGRPVVVNFWFPSCPPCVAEMPDLEAAFQRHKNDVEFIGIQLVGLDSAKDGQEFIDKLKVNYAIGPDLNGALVREYKITGFPATVFLDAEHNIVRTWTGMLNEEQIGEFVQELLN